MASIKYLSLTRGGCEDQHIINRSSHQKTMSDASYDQRGPNAYDPLCRESHDLPYVSCTMHEMVESMKESPSRAFKPSEHQSPRGGCLQWDSPQYRGDYLRLRERRNLPSDHNNHRAPVAKRRSVFSRLSLGPEVNKCHEPYVEASADEVMEMLQQINQSNAPKKLRGFKATGKYKDERHVVSENVTLGLKERLNNEDEEVHDLPKDDNIIEEETQILGFGRRSEAKKNLALVDEADAVYEVKEASTTKVPPKRRKLIRPDFGKE